MPRFASGSDGYDRGEADRFAEEATANERQLRDRVTELERERSELERELERLRGELDATRSALPEISELHSHLQKLREDYAARTDALQMLIAAAAREIGERTGVGPPPRPDPVRRRPPAPRAQPQPEPRPPVRPGADETVTDEIDGPEAPEADTEPDDEPEGLPGRPVWRPDVDEPVRGDWWTEDPPEGGRRA